MAKNKIKDKRLLVGANMPPLYHSLPNEKFSFKNSEVLKWIAKRPGLLSYLFEKLKDAEYISYDSITGKWQGINFVADEDE